MSDDVAAYFESAVEDIAAAGSAAAGAELAEAYGFLGQLFLAYALDEQAQECLSRAIQLQPEQAAWPYLRAIAASRSGDAQAAVAYFQQALAARPDYHAASVNLAAIYRDLGRFDDADRVLSRLPAGDDAPASLLAAIGEHLLATDRAGLALQPLKAALRTQPQATRLHYLIGQAYRSLGDRKQAKFHLGQAGEIGLAVVDPYMDSVTRLGRSEVLLIQGGQKAFLAGDFASAARAFEDALKLQPDSIRAKVNLASALGEIGQAKEAKALFAEVLRAEPDNAAALYNLARLEAADGQLGAASEYYQRLAAVSPDDALATWEHARILRALGQPDAALDRLVRVKSRPEFFKRAVLLEAEILVEQQRTSEALASLEQAVRLLPADAEVVLTAANMLSIAPGALRDPQRALQLAEGAFTTNPGSAAAESVGLALAALGRCEEAISWLRRAAGLTSDEGIGMRLLGIADGFASKNSCVP